MMLGWECPRCHTCYAPHIERCGNCLPQTWASNGATGLPIPGSITQYVGAGKTPKGGKNDAQSEIDHGHS